MNGQMIIHVHTLLRLSSLIYFSIDKRKFLLEISTFLVCCVIITREELSRMRFSVLAQTLLQLIMHYNDHFSC